MLASPDPLVDGNMEGVVATCMAKRARPPADVFWEAELYGHSEQIMQDELDGTTSTKVDYIWAPSSHALNHALTCVVRHPALAMDLRIPYVLNIQCKLVSLLTLLGSYHLELGIISLIGV